MTKREKAFQEKHFMAGYNVRTLPYMLHHNLFVNRKQRVRFNIDRFRATVLMIIKKADGCPEFPWPQRASRAATMQKGVFFEYRNMTFQICGYGNGVRRNAK